MNDGKDIDTQDLMADRIHQYLQILSLKEEWATGLQQCILNEIRKDPHITANKLVEHLTRSYDGQLEPEMASIDTVARTMLEYGYVFYLDSGIPPQSFDDWDPYGERKEQEDTKELDAAKKELAGKICELSHEYDAKKKDVKTALEELRQKKIVELLNGKSCHRRYAIDYGMIDAYHLGLNPFCSCNLSCRTATEDMAEETGRRFNNDTPEKQKRRLQYMIDKGELRPYTVHDADRKISFTVPKWIFGEALCVRDCCLTADEFPELYDFFDSATNYYEEYCNKIQPAMNPTGYDSDEAVYWHYINRIARAYLADPDNTFVTSYTGFLKAMTLMQDRADDKVMSSELKEIIDSINGFIDTASSRNLGWGLKSPYLNKQHGEDFLVFYLLWGIVTESGDGNCTEPKDGGNV